jgi:hypothetical protein
MTPFLRVEGAALLKRLILFWAVCAALGAFLGLVWPAKGWRWGLWLVGPFWVLGALSFLFTGGVHLLLTKDIPQLAITALVECGGAYIGARSSAVISKVSSR